MKVLKPATAIWVFKKRTALASKQLTIALGSLKLIWLTLYFIVIPSFFFSSHRNMNDSGIRLTLPPVNVLAGACCRWIENWSCERSWLPVNFIMIAERSLVEKLGHEKIRIIYWVYSISFSEIRMFCGNLVYYCTNCFQYLITWWWYIGGAEKNQRGRG